VSIDIGAIVERAKLAAAEGRKDRTPSADEREQLTKIAAEFESMLLVQMLKDMRQAGSWDDGDDEQDTLGAAALFETLDAELAVHLARVKGMGLKEELLAALDRARPDRTGASEGAPAAPVLAPAAAPAAVVVVAPAAPSNVEAAPAPLPVRGHPGHEGGLVRPVSGEVTSAYGWRVDPFTQRPRFHQGVDMRAAYGQEVQAAAGGRVVFSGEQGGYGTTVVLQHGDGTRTRYAHLSAALVAEGDAVQSGAPIGRAGRSGRATGTHLHFEVIGSDGRRVSPEQWARLDGRRAATSAD
jgi:murein DD-endopeptidase MepM/ murein hydrolase activator NlpD